jgi:hypothetical protein
MSAAWRDLGYCTTTNPIRISSTTWSVNSIMRILVAQLDRRLQEQLDRIGDPFRPGAYYVQHWGFELGVHGSVPYGTPDARPQSPRRRPDP